MKKQFMLVLVLLLSASAASAGTTTQKWTAGWQNFDEPLNYKKSNVRWSVNPTKKTLSVTFTLVGARPSKLYQVQLTAFCTTFPATFGQFPNVFAPDLNCLPYTAQGVTKNVSGAEFGVVTTDIHGNGTFAVVIGPIAAGSYDLEFAVEDGGGCFLAGGAGQDQLGDDCNNDFQSPGPTRGDTITITIP